VHISHPKNFEYYSSDHDLAVHCETFDWAPANHPSASSTLQTTHRPPGEGISHAPSFADDTLALVVNKVVAHESRVRCRPLKAKLHAARDARPFRNRAG
jgi:hypothetical protein